MNRTLARGLLADSLLSLGLAGLLSLFAPGGHAKDSPSVCATRREESTLHQRTCRWPLAGIWPRDRSKREAVCRCRRDGILRNGHAPDHRCCDQRRRRAVRIEFRTGCSDRRHEFTGRDDLGTQAQLLREESEPARRLPGRPEDARRRFDQAMGRPNGPLSRSSPIMQPGSSRFSRTAMGRTTRASGQVTTD